MGWRWIQVCTNNNWKSDDRKGKLNRNAKRHLMDIWGDEEPSSGYSTCVVKVDTKEYYLPQTRKRCYMVCIDRKTIGTVEAEKLARQWAVMLKQLQRNASSPMDDFLLSAGGGEPPAGSAGVLTSSGLDASRGV
ncbi:MAG: hypothetical protein LQ346_008313 [Caloplaca aetnensis]|nr:MAG: hypothetical protein LQ346_008313 [Caloplaca aetnensis]